MLKEMIKNALIITRLNKLLQLRRKNRVIILMYHGFFDESDAEGIEQYGTRWCGINKFKSQISYLKKNYNIISLDLLHQHFANGEALPDNAVIITMDDGFESNYSLAYPLLKRDHIPFAIFVSTGFVDTGKLLWADRLDYAIWKYHGDRLKIILDSDRVLEYSTINEKQKMQTATEIRNILQSLSFQDRDHVITQIEQTSGIPSESKDNAPKLQTPLSWPQIQELANDPLVSFGSHTVNHPNLTTCSDEKLEYELTESKQRLEEKIGAGRFCPVFCYPGGAFDNRVEKFVEKAGYSSALAIGGKSNPIQFPNRYNIKRIGIGRDMKLNDMIYRLCTC